MNGQIRSTHVTFKFMSEDHHALRTNIELISHYLNFTGIKLVSIQIMTSRVYKDFFHSPIPTNYQYMTTYNNLHLGRVGSLISLWVLYTHTMDSPIYESNNDSYQCCFGV